jgi:aryl-alcohol dehydrogenase-like predicted oxidoreductase
MPKRIAGEPPAITLGTMNFGKRTTAAESERIVARALERGIRVFDTANIYNAGESERILGRALGRNRNRDRDRDRVILATKVGLNPALGKPEGLRPEAMAKALAASLERLGTDHIDIYYLHAPDHGTPIEQTLEGMKRLVDGGGVRAWGASNYASWQILEMRHLCATMGLPGPEVSQLLYNAVHRQLDIEYFAFARRYPIHTTVYNPLAGGLLAGTHRLEDAPPPGSRFDGNDMYRRRYWTREMFDRVEQLRAVAELEGMSLVELAYAWVASRPDVDSILVGPADVAQLDHAIDAIQRPVSEAARSRIDELARAWSGSDTAYVR